MATKPLVIGIGGTTRVGSTTEKALAVALRVQDAAKQSEHRFRHRHQDVRRARRHIIGIALDDNPAVTERNQGIGARPLQKSVEGERRPFGVRYLDVDQVHRLGGQEAGICSPPPALFGICRAEKVANLACCSFGTEVRETRHTSAPATGMMLP